MSGPPQSLRVDKWLWYARFFKTRGGCSRLVTGGKLRLNAEKINKAAQAVRVGDTLTFPQARAIRVVRVVALGQRRGPAPEAQTLYEDLSPTDETAKDTPDPKQGRLGRPDKRDRRAARAFRRSPLE